MKRSDVLKTKREFVRALAIRLDKNKQADSKFTPMSIKHLAKELNDAGIRTNGGDKFIGDRGTHRLLEAVYRWLDQDQKDTKTARLLWHVFQRPKSLQNQK